jgi:hypothetical protein
MEPLVYAAIAAGIIASILGVPDLIEPSTMTAKFVKVW